MIRVHKQEQVRIAALFSSPGELYKQEGGSVWRSHFVLPDKEASKHSSKAQVVSSFNILIKGVIKLLLSKGKGQDLCVS